MANPEITTVRAVNAFEIKKSGLKPRVEWRVARENLKALRLLDGAQVDILPVLEHYEPNHMHDPDGNIFTPFHLEYEGIHLSPTEIVERFPWIDFKIDAGDLWINRFDVVLNTTRIEGTSLHSVFLPYLTHKTIERTKRIPWKGRKFEIADQDKGLINDLLANVKPI